MALSAKLALQNVGHFDFRATITKKSRVALLTVDPFRVCRVWKERVEHRRRPGKIEIESKGKARYFGWQVEAGYGGARCYDTAAQSRHPVDIPGVISGQELHHAVRIECVFDRWTNGIGRQEQRPGWTCR